MALGGVGNPDEGRLLGWAAGEVVKRHLMSLYFMAPLIGICAGFLWHNWWVHPGGAALNVPGTLRGRSPATLSAISQAWLSQPSPFKDISPRLSSYSSSLRYSTSSSRVHSFSDWYTVPDTDFLRESVIEGVPNPLSYDAATDTLSPSIATFDKPPSFISVLILEVLAFLRFVRLEKVDGRIRSTTNLTILNTLLVNAGPLHEQTLCSLMAGVQIAGSILAFGIRYGVGSWVYGGERR
jgi:UDP-N-acetylglucosamine--dolichyl-phosphate N-acetylglucosaminephosphotransferase